MTKPEFYLVRGEVGAWLGLVFGQRWDPAVDILTQIQQRYLKPSFVIVVRPAPFTSGSDYILTTSF